MGAQDPVIANAAVARVFAAYPPKLRKRLLAVRRGREKTHIRLQGIPEEQGYVLDNLAEFLFEV